MKNILFLTPDNWGIMKAVKAELAKRTDLQVDYIDWDIYKNKFRYKNFFHRATNFYLKTFKKINLKPIYFNNLVKEEINRQKDHYDRIVIIRPDLLSDELLALLRAKTNDFVAYYWDSMSLFPRKHAIKELFDKVYSFDLEDCKNFGFTPLNNFYYYEDIPATISNNVYCLISYDKRITVLEKMGEYLHSKGISSTIKVYRKKPFKHKYVIPVQTVIPYETMLGEMADSSILLEIQKDNQVGLTFRAIESLGLKKKLITNNRQIKSYDFYDEHNIFVIETNEIDIPDSFFATPYKEIDEAIRSKYHLKEWINTLFLS